MQRVTCLFSKPTPEDRPADSASRRRSSGFRDNVKRLFTSRSIIGGSTSTSNDVSPSPPATDGKKAQEKPFNPHQSKVDLAFAPVEASLNELEESLRSARLALNKVKQESVAALEAMEMIAAVGGKESISAAAAEGENEEDLVDLSELTFDDIDYGSSAMAPPFLDPDSCLLPDAEPVVRIEKAPENSRRIFAGIDILASADDVWNVLTNYGELQNVIPNLVVNDVLELYDGSDETKSIDAIAGDEAVPEEVRCEKLANTKKGSLLRQVGGAKVAGIQFSARTTLEVREWPTGMPDFAHFLDDVWEGESREARAGVLKDTKLKRYRFPRPFCVGDKKLPTKDISMQSIVGDDGEFRLYQGVWRMQPLVGCSPPGKEAMRLTYAVEISPRPYLPVRLVEGRIVADLCSNLEAIRAAVTSP